MGACIIRRQVRTARSRTAICVKTWARSNLYSRTKQARSRKTRCSSKRLRLQGEVTDSGTIALDQLAMLLHICLPTSASRWSIQAAPPICLLRPTHLLRSHHVKRHNGRRTQTPMRIGCRHPPPQVFLRARGPYLRVQDLYNSTKRKKQLTVFSSALRFATLPFQSSWTWNRACQRMQRLCQQGLRLQSFFLQARAPMTPLLMMCSACCERRPAGRSTRVHRLMKRPCWQPRATTATSSDGKLQAKWL
mmetsp:Transcript_84409/g.154088  ORF Transcript_84409/g.154088 Transcript_84409/m.154088 type:complete len:248 (+) Transcript_84409:199-942(+)